jgi:hypothetical protein
VLNSIPFQSMVSMLSTRWGTTLRSGVGWLSVWSLCWSRGPVHLTFRIALNVPGEEGRGADSKPIAEKEVGNGRVNSGGPAARNWKEKRFVLDRFQVGEVVEGRDIDIDS